MYQKIVLNDREWSISAQLHTPSTGKPPFPGLVMGPGFAAHATHYQAYAHTLSQAGLMVVLFDPRHFGASQGELYHAIDPEQQCHDYRTAHAYLQNHPLVDPKRIALWGSSLSGGHVLKLASESIDIACLVAELPFISGRANHALRQTIRPKRTQTITSRPKRLSPTIPVVEKKGAYPQDTVLFYGKDAHDFFTRVPDWPNHIHLRSIIQVGCYEPARHIEKIKVPSLIITNPNDEVNAWSSQKDAFARMQCKKKWIALETASHFSPYLETPPQTCIYTQAWLMTLLTGLSH